MSPYITKLAGAVIVSSSDPKQEHRIDDEEM